MNISVDDLRNFDGNDDWYKKFGEGYRIVFLYPNNKYYVSSYSKTIEGFMVEFCEEYPIMDDDDIPKFISNDDLLNRYLDRLDDISAVAIYKTDGTCVEKKSREEKNKYNIIL